MELSSTSKFPCLLVSILLNRFVAFPNLHADDTSNDTASTLGYDPSYAHQGWATVAVWTGGSGRKPVNVGNVIDHELHTKVSRTLETSCPSKQTTHGMYCDNLKWQDFQTHYLETPPAGVKETVTWFRTTAAQWATEEIRIIMLNIIGRMLYAYTTQDKGTNCYEVPGQGIFCNIPQFIRVSTTHHNMLQQLLTMLGQPASNKSCCP